MSRRTRAGTCRAERTATACGCSRSTARSSKCLAAQQPTLRLTSNANIEVNLEAGKTAYFNSCVFCHGADGTGGHGGPPFTTALSTDTIQRTVAGGRNQMPAFGGFLDEADVANVSAWVRELAQHAEGKKSN